MGIISWVVVGVIAGIIACMLSGHPDQGLYD